MLPREAQAAEHLGLSGKDAGEQKEPFEELLVILEGDGQKAGLKRNPVGEFHERLRIREDDLHRAGRGFRLELDDAVDDALMPLLLDGDGRILDPLFEPANEVALVDGELAADADCADLVHEIDRLALLQSEESLYVPATEKGNGFWGSCLGQDFRKLMNVRRMVWHGANL